MAVLYKNSTLHNLYTIDPKMSRPPSGLPFSSSRDIPSFARLARRGALLDGRSSPSLLHDGTPDVKSTGRALSRISIVKGHTRDKLSQLVFR